jgi:hypothetical protein
VHAVFVLKTCEFEIPLGDPFEITQTDLVTFVVQMFGNKNMELGRTRAHTQLQEPDFTVLANVGGF